MNEKFEGPSLERIRKAAEELKGVVVIGTTNRLDLVDPALLRAGRFDFLLEVPKPDEKTRCEIFKIYTKEKPLGEDIDLKNLAKETEGLTGADIEAICQKASVLAIREFVELSNPLSRDFKKPSTRAKLGAGLVPHRNEVSGAGLKISAKHFKMAMPR